MDNIHISYTNVLHFLTVTKYMNMNRAAEELYITQPALSLSISKLEKALGITLFYREKNKLILSKDATTLLPHMEKYRQAHDLLLQEAADLLKSSNESVKVAYSGSPYTFAMLYFSNVLNNYDKATVNVTYMDSNMALNLLLAGQADFVISNTSLSHPLISSIILHIETIGIVLPVKHWLASREILSFEDIKDMKFHGLSEKHDFRILCDSICRSQGITPNYITESDYNTYRKYMEAADGIGCFFSTRQNFNLNFASKEAYVYRDITPAVLSRKISIYFLPNENKQFQHDKLIELIQRVIIKQSALTSRFSKTINEEFPDILSYVEI